MLDIHGRPAKYSITFAEGSFGYAYALDLVTKSLVSPGQYAENKVAFFKTSETEVQTLPAKRARFEVWPEMKLQQADETPLSEYLEALNAGI